MALHSFKVTIGDQVYLEHNDEEIGAVREVARDHLIIYIENSGDVQIAAPAVKSAHDGKVVLDSAKLDSITLAAVRHAHQRETD